MDVSAEKEVYFDQYCPKCEHEDKPSHEEPCNDCLNNPSNINSHKPVNWKKKDV